MSLKPVLIYDGDCGFCKHWIRRWNRLTGNKVEYAPYQMVWKLYPQIHPDEFKKSVQLVDSDSKVYSGAEAVFRSLAPVPGKRWLLTAYQKIPFFRRLSETFYCLVARNRIFFSQATHFFWGNDLAPQTFHLSLRFFMKGLAVIYFIAFFSLESQIQGLAGSNGILPVSVFLKDIYAHTGPQGYRLLPTLAWLNSSDAFLKFLCQGGAFLSILLLFDIAPALVLFLLWVFYLSLVNAGQEFLSFQWDSLLLETGFLAIWAACPVLLRKDTRNAVFPAPIRLLFNWLLFRLIFMSGFVKLASGDATWRNLTALTYHYETQPLPHWISWYAHHLPAVFQRFSAAVMFAIELVFPFFIFSPPRTRFMACAGFLFLQLMIFLTGNYGFFNLLAALLCLPLIDDHFWRQLFSIKEPDDTPGRTLRPRAWPKTFIQGLAVLIFLLTAQQTLRAMKMPAPLVPLNGVSAAVRPFRSFNNYGLFAVMTKTRPEIIIEGSNDGKDWRRYSFRYKADSINRMPHFASPYMPRLDWQMWFAALGRAEDNPWFIPFCVKLLEGSPQVLDLLETNPFPAMPPRYLRAILYLYRFSDRAAKQTTGAWWDRERVGKYIPEISLAKQSHAAP